MDSLPVLPSPARPPVHVPQIQTVPSLLIAPSASSPAATDTTLPKSLPLASCATWYGRTPDPVPSIPASPEGLSPHIQTCPVESTPRLWCSPDCPSMNVVPAGTSIG